MKVLNNERSLLTNTCNSNDLNNRLSNCANDLSTIRRQSISDVSDLAIECNCLISELGTSVYSTCAEKEEKKRDIRTSNNTQNNKNNIAENHRSNENDHSSSLLINNKHAFITKVEDKINSNFIRQSLRNNGEAVVKDIITNSLIKIIHKKIHKNEFKEGIRISKDTIINKSKMGFSTTNLNDSLNIAKNSPIKISKKQKKNDSNTTNKNTDNTNKYDLQKDAKVISCLKTNSNNKINKNINENSDTSSCCMIF